jgi:hypothetical protein
MPKPPRMGIALIMEGWRPSGSIVKESEKKCLT